MYKARVRLTGKSTISPVSLFLTKHLFNECCLTQTPHLVVVHQKSVPEVTWEVHTS